jgi:uncharacterized protein (UPF0276 family)
MKISLDNPIGIGLRSQHISQVILEKPPIGWVEVHSENWFAESEAIADQLSQICATYPISLHGVGLSLGSADGVDSRHLRKLKRLMLNTRPILISEHISWGRIGQYHTNELLPLPYCDEALDILARNINEVQNALGRQILVENISHYGVLSDSCMPEWEFISRLIEATGCGLLLDINNVYVTAKNTGGDLSAIFDQIPWWSVQEVHLAGYEEQNGLLIDSHSKAIQSAVWTLYQQAIHRLPNTVLTLIEWDTDLPALSVLLHEALKAKGYWQGGRDAVA